MKHFRTIEIVFCVAGIHKQNEFLHFFQQEVVAIFEERICNILCEYSILFLW